MFSYVTKNVTLGQMYQFYCRYEVGRGSRKNNHCYTQNIFDAIFPIINPPFMHVLPMSHNYDSLKTIVTVVCLGILDVYFDDTF